MPDYPGYPGGPLVYVGGIVDRSPTVPFPFSRASQPDERFSEWHWMAVQYIGFKAAEYGVHAMLPQLDPAIDRLPAPHFFEVIRTRIGMADGVISLLSGDDPATAAESCLADAQDKPQLVIGRDQRSVPRLIRGMPSVLGVAITDQIPASDIDSFLYALSRGPGGVRGRGDQPLRTR